MTGKYDSILIDAVKLAFECDMVSIDILQKHLHIGYARASRLMDQLEEINIIAKAKKTFVEPRQVLLNSYSDYLSFKSVNSPLDITDLFVRMIEYEKCISWLEENVASLEKKMFSKEHYKDDELYKLAKTYTLTRARVSPAILQRIFSINYEAARS